MSQGELASAVKDFQEVIKASERLRAKGTRMAVILGTFFAMWCAFRIRRNVATLDGDAIEEPLEGAIPISQLEPNTAPPEPDTVHRAGAQLIAATISNDFDGKTRALAEMGVLDLCPKISQQFTRMELVARSIQGRAQLIPLVELSLFAVEFGEFERAAKYALEARVFDPAAYELYSLCVVDGLIAMNAGRDHEAIQYLQRSIGACQRDEYASLACGVRSLNLALVARLLDGGHRVEVLEHLLECKNVWQSFRPQIDVWISLIESGARPNFYDSPTLRSMNEPACRLIVQYSRARALEEGNSLGLAAPQSSVPMSPAQVMARREKLREAYRLSKDRPATN